MSRPPGPPGRPRVTAATAVAFQSATASAITGFAAQIIQLRTTRLVTLRSVGIGMLFPFRGDELQLPLRSAQSAEVLTGQDPLSPTAPLWRAACVQVQPARNGSIDLRAVSAP